MRWLFLYGSLLDPAVFRRVAGVELAGLDAVLGGWRRVAMSHGPYPTLRRAAGGAVRGLLVQADGRVFARLCEYEGPRWRLREVVVEAQGRAIAALAWIAAGGSRRDWP